MATVTNKYFSKFQFGFKKRLCIIALIEKWKSAVDSGKSFEVLLTDLWKSFGWLPYELLLTKLDVYGFSLSALRLICNHLCNRQQRANISASHSSWEEILFEVPQGSILGSLVLNIFFMCDLFTILKEIDFDSLQTAIPPLYLKLLLKM